MSFSLDLDKISEKEEKEAKDLFSKIQKQMHGRICISNNVHQIYLIRKKMGKNCKVYCEIGVLFGGTLCYLMQDKTPCKYIGIDPFNGYYGQKVDPVTKLEVSVENALKNIDKMNIHKHKAILIKGSSHNCYTVQRLLDVTDEVDFLLIDGDHSKEGVIKDFINYHSFVSENGIICFDNYADPKWKGVQEGVDSINFNYYGFERIGEYGHCLIIKRRDKE